MATIEFTLDGEQVTAREGETILDVARRKGKQIPTLCHDPRLEPFTSCFVCLVEMQGKPGFVPSCATKVAAGMNVTTDSPQIQAARKLALELIMSAHNADCVAPCRLQCPDNIDIQTYIAQIAAGEFAEALKTIKRTNPFPSVCGRVCPHTCEIQCRRNKVDEAVAINPLKRFVADQDLAQDAPYLPPVAEDSGKKVAVIGAGPAGLTAAYYLRQKGHAVTVFEMNPKAGGMLRYGIPYYRLPEDQLDAEIASILALGIDLVVDHKLGRDFSLSDLRAQGFDSVFLGVGAWTSSSMRVEGEDMTGVMTGIDYLFRVAAGDAPDVGKRVVVVGGGNTAVDAARTARRAGAEVTILYRRTRNEMPAEAYEVDEAELEGVKMHFLAAPVGLIGANGRVQKVRSIKMELGEPDASGRRRPVPIDGSEFEIELDTIIAAIGQKPDPASWKGEGAPGVTRWNSVEANERTYQTAVPWIFTGGDCLTGAATAVEAIAGGRKASISIDRYLRGLEPLPIGKPFSDSIGRLEDLDDALFAHVEKAKRAKGRELPIEQRLDNFNEVELGLDQAQAVCEAARCLECGCSSVETCTLRNLADEYEVDLARFDVEFRHRPVLDDHPFLVYDPNKCILCGRCVRICLEQQGAGALGFVDRGFETSIQPSLAMPLLTTDCDACGQCISTCPSGAIESKQFATKKGPYPVEEKALICGFCGLACRMKLELAGQQVIQAATTPGAFHNRGNLCVDGAFGHRYLETSERVREPMIGSAAVRRAASWSEAIAAAAAGLDEARRGKGLAVLVNGPLTNETAYLLGRLARTRLATNRIAMLDGAGANWAPSGLGLGDLEQADAIWVIGDDPFETAPVAGVALRRALAAGTPAVILSPRSTRLDQLASRALRLNDGQLVALLLGLAAFVKKGQIELLFDLAVDVGLKPQALAAMAEGLKKARRPVLACDSELSQSIAGALDALLAAVKHPGRMLVLPRVGNAVGRRLMGLDPAWLPGGLNAGLAGDRKKIEKLWNERLPSGKASQFQVIEAVRRGDLSGVLVVNSDPYASPLDRSDIPAGVFCVAIDLVVGSLSDRADVLLPGCGLAECEGTVTGLDCQVMPTGAARAPVGGKDLFQIIGLLADALGNSIPLAKPKQVWWELERLKRGLGGLAGPELKLAGKKWNG